MEGRPVPPPSGQDRRIQSVQSDCFAVFSVPVDSTFPIATYEPGFVTSLMNDASILKADFVFPILLGFQDLLTFRDPTNSYLLALRKLFAIGFMAPRMHVARHSGDLLAALNIVCGKAGNFQELLPKVALPFLLLWLNFHFF